MFLTIFQKVFIKNISPHHLFMMVFLFRRRSWPWPSRTSASCTTSWWAEWGHTGRHTSGILLPTSKLNIKYEIFPDRNLGPRVASRNGAAKRISSNIFTECCKIDLESIFIIIFGAFTYISYFISSILSQLTCQIYILVNYSCKCFHIQGSVNIWRMTNRIITRSWQDSGVDNSASQGLWLVKTQNAVLWLADIRSCQTDW